MASRVLTHSFVTAPQFLDKHTAVGQAELLIVNVGKHVPVAIWPCALSGKSALPIVIALQLFSRVDL